jgi:hypothetical protein
MPKGSRCLACEKDRSNANHLEHVRTYMREHYGSDVCIRKGCETIVERFSGYCNQHHTEWVHGENIRHLDMLSVQEKPSSVRDQARTCNKCNQPVAHPTSSYCILHRREYMRKYRDRRKQAH